MIYDNNFDLKAKILVTSSSQKRFVWVVGLSGLIWSVCFSWLQCGTHLVFFAGADEEAKETSSKGQGWEYLHGEGNINFSDERRKYAKESTENVADSKSSSRQNHREYERGWDIASTHWDADSELGHKHKGCNYEIVVYKLFLEYQACTPSSGDWVADKESPARGKFDV